jgi:hypothetical protein
MHNRTSRLLGVVAGAALALGLGFPASAATEAPTPPPLTADAVASTTSPYFDVTKLSAKDLVIASSTAGCQSVTVTMARKVGNGMKNWDAFVDVTRGSQIYSSVWFSSDSNPTTDRFTFCASDNFGKYTIGPSDWFANSSSVYKSGLDTTKGYFYVRAKTKASISSIARSGGYTTVKASATRFKPHGYPSDYVKFSAPKAYLQVKSGTTWKTVLTTKLVNGAASFKYKTSSSRTYRVSIPQTDSTTAVISGSKTK